MTREVETPVSETLMPHAQAASRLVLSQLAPGAVQSEIRAMTTECDRIGGINLAQGVCDTPVPAVVEAEALAAIKAGHNIYTRLDGIERLRNAISAKQQREYGLSYDPETEVLVASGATGGLHAAAMALLNPGDEVLLFEPFYGYHAGTLKSMRVKPVPVPLGRARLGSRYRRLSGCNYTAHPRHPSQHARQSERKGLQSRRDRGHRRRLPRA